MSKLQISNLQKRYDKKHPKQHEPAAFTLQPLSLTIEDGEFLAILGPSGCGKTTLLKLVAGLLAPDEGEIIYHHRKMHTVPAEKRGFGMVFQQALLFPHMTVEENVAFGLKMQGVGKKERLQKAEEILASVGLNGMGSRSPSVLSGGQQQRVSLARGFLSGSKVLLMDEPFSALDPGLREEMRELLGKLHQKHRMTVFFVTHDREEAFILADRIGVMNNGSLMQVGTPEELYMRPNHPEVALFMGAKNVIPGEMKDGVFHCADFELKLSEANGTTEGLGWLMIRPEILELSQETSGLQSCPYIRYLHGIIKQITFRQGFYYLKVESGSIMLDMMGKQLHDRPLRRGEASCLQLDVRQTYFIRE